MKIREDQGTVRKKNSLEKLGEKAG